MKLKRGFLIVLEGIDGSGKTTQARLLVRALRRAGLGVLSFREPTRGRWGREIRRKARRPDSLTPQQELSLFLKDRRENVDRNLLPALSRNKVIILDRYYFSTIAYQGAKGIPRERIRRLNERFAPRPDLVFILDVDPRRGLGRIKSRPTKEPLFEREAYLVRVRRIFRSFRGRKFVYLDGTRDKKEIAELIRRRVMRLVHRRRQEQTNWKIHRMLGSAQLNKIRAVQDSTPGNRQTPWPGRLHPQPGKYGRESPGS